MSFLTLLKKPEHVFYFLFPIVSGYLTANICPMNSGSGSKIKFRPPGYIFGIVWPILYLLLGAAWIYSNKYGIYYLIISLLLCLWLVVYSCLKQKKHASWVLLASLFMSFLTYTISNKTSQLLISPLIIWLLFALLMNIMEVQLL